MNSQQENILIEAEYEGISKVKHLQAILNYMIEDINAIPKHTIMEQYVEELEKLDPESSIKTLANMSLMQLKTSGTADFDLVSTTLLLFSHICNQIAFYKMHLHGTELTFKLAKWLNKELHIDDTPNCPFDIDKLNKGMKDLSNAINACAKALGYQTSNFTNK